MGLGALVVLRIDGLGRLSLDQRLEHGLTPLRNTSMSPPASSIEQFGNVRLTEGHRIGLRPVLGIPAPVARSSAPASRTDTKPWPPPRRPSGQRDGDRRRLVGVRSPQRDRRRDGSPAQQPRLEATGGCRGDLRLAGRDRGRPGSAGRSRTGGQTWLCANRPNWRDGGR